MWALEKTVLGGHMLVGQGLMQAQQDIRARAWKVWGNAEWTSLPSESVYRIQHHIE